MSKRKKKAAIDPLRDWGTLNRELMKLETAAAVEQLLKREQTNRNRWRFAMRIHARLNKLRAEAERNVILAGTAT